MIAGQNALKDAEAMWEASADPVYGDPTCPESEFSDFPVRSARRGLRWGQLDLGHGVNAACRIIRNGSRAKFGYGISKPSRPPKLFGDHDEYYRANQK